MTLPSVRRVLIHRLGSLGDTLVAMPAFRLVRATYPDARITVLTNHAHSDHAKSVGMPAILDGAGLADDYLYYPVALRNVGALLRLRNRIARERFDVVIYLSSPGSTLKKVARDALFFLSCGITCQRGFPYRLSGRVNAQIAGTHLYQSESDRLVSNLKQVGEVELDDDRWWDLGLNDDERKRAGEHLVGAIGEGPFFAISVGTKADVNDWTQPNWLALVRALGERFPDHGLVALGSPDELDRSQALLDQWGGPRLNLCGKLLPRESAAILEQAGCFLGHDSGPMHLAANVGTPCVAVFSARVFPGVWYPRGTGHQVIYHQTECANCWRFVCEEHRKKCILSISHQEVVRAVDKVLRDKMKPQTLMSL